MKMITRNQAIVNSYKSISRSFSISFYMSSNTTIDGYSMPYSYSGNLFRIAMSGNSTLVRSKSWNVNGVVSK